MARNILIGKSRHQSRSDREREKLQAQISTYAVRHQAEQDAEERRKLEQRIQAAEVPLRASGMDNFIAYALWLVDATLALLLISVLLGNAAQAQSTDAAKAAQFVQVLHSEARNPDSFVLEAVALKPNKKGDPNICVVFRAQNGFGGMTREEWVLTKWNRPMQIDPTVPEWVMPQCKAKELVDITGEVQAILKK
jgi:hypothetical protein